MSLVHRILPGLAATLCLAGSILAFAPPLQGQPIPWQDLVTLRWSTGRQNGTWRSLNTGLIRSEPSGPGTPEYQVPDGKVLVVTKVMVTFTSYQGGRATWFLNARPPGADDYEVLRRTWLLPPPVQPSEYQDIRYECSLGYGLSFGPGTRLSTGPYSGTKLQLYTVECVGYFTAAPSGPGR